MPSLWGEGPRFTTGWSDAAKAVSSTRATPLRPKDGAALGAAGPSRRVPPGRPTSRLGRLLARLLAPEPPERTTVWTLGYFRGWSDAKAGRDYAPAERQRLSIVINTPDEVHTALYKEWGGE